jgi:hypothetical protein
LLTLVVAGALSAVALTASVRALRRCLEVSERGAAAGDDELERRLADKERALVLGLGSRNVRALGRAALFGGTGCAVWELTGGGAHYLLAGGSFGLGMVGWMGCGELYRRIGSLAGARRALRKVRR